MGEYLCTKERVLNDLKDHKMLVALDQDSNRIIRFRRKDRITYWFDLITWPGCLCISGDCGTYVFTRLDDMFEFFRGEGINPSYWGEKLISVCTYGGYREFDSAKFRERVIEHFDTYWEEADYPDAKVGCWREIQTEVLSRIEDGEQYAYQAVQDFEYRYGDFLPVQRKSFSFQDFFDGGGTDRFTFHYIWCLYAIVWGVAEYDKWKQGQ